MTESLQNSSSSEDQENESYTLPIKSPLVPGSFVFLKGRIPPESERFSVNLVCEQPSSTDIALHINPRFDQHFIVFNHRNDATWGTEANVNIRPFKLRRDEFFTMYILIAEDKYFVSINEKHCIIFDFRIPIKRITALEIHDVIDIEECFLSSTVNYPDERYTFEYLELRMNESHSTIEMPFLCHLTNGFSAGNEIEIEATMKLLPFQFAINLQDTPYLWPHPLVPFHLNPRFQPTTGTMAIVRNSWKDGQWGKEERAPQKTFRPGHTFNLRICCEADQYSIWVEKNLIGSFPFRMEATLAKYLYITGDIKLHTIKYNDTVKVLYKNEESPNRKMFRRKIL